MTIDLNTRESWLNAAVLAMAPWFAEVGETVPPLKVSIGWPKGARGKHVVGQCWSPANAEDGVSQIFISPDRSGDTDAVDILGTLLHEVVHAVVGVEEQHKGRFVTVSRALGFLPKFTSSANRTEELTERLAGIAERLGPLPHGALSVGAKKATQKTYMLAVKHDPCGWKIRATAKQISMALVPITCWVCGEHAEVAGAEVDPEGV